LNCASRQQRRHGAEGARRRSGCARLRAPSCCRRQAIWRAGRPLHVDRRARRRRQAGAACAPTHCPQTCSSCCTHRACDWVAAAVLRYSILDRPPWAECILLGFQVGHLPKATHPLHALAHLPRRSPARCARRTTSRCWAPRCSSPSCSCHRWAGRWTTWPQARPANRHLLYGTAARTRVCHTLGAPRCRQT